MIKAIIFDNPSIYKVFLDNTFEDFRCARVIPSTLRINDRNRTINASTKAVSLGSKDHGQAACQVKFFKAVFQKHPRHQASFPCTAFWFALVSTKKNVARKLLQTKRLGNLLELLDSHDY